MSPQLHEPVQAPPFSRAPIAVIGLGCWYPGARDPIQFWENILTRRRQFRRMPETRLNLADYHDATGSSSDHTYARQAALIDGFCFDWIGRRIPKSTYESTDLVHWLALDVAEQALADAGYARVSVPRDRTGVVVGNTLTGDITRANCMRLRWPFVRRALEAAASARGLPTEVQEALCNTMEDYYKSVFPVVTEDTLAGGLANTIAGRICNFFDLHGGGYIVDGACSSSLLSVCTASRALSSGDLDLALAGGIDISLDPFELVGFAQAGALATNGMYVYDKRAAGFIPGEGCGFVVLKRLEDARRDGDMVYAVVRGWGISSDGKGGMMTPSREGQEKAIRRAYTHAGYTPQALDFVEGHGTGTRVGDRIELEAIAAAATADTLLPPRQIGVTSLKSIVGHTKAAAGIGAFIKAVIAVNRRILPPTASCLTPNEVFDDEAQPLYPIIRGRVLDPSTTVRAGVSAMGFGGINSHVTLESGDRPSERLTPSIAERPLLASHQETEIFVLSGVSVDELLGRVGQLTASTAQLSVGDLTDLAAQLSRDMPPADPVRSAVIASSPEELAERLKSLTSLLETYPPDDGEVTSTPRRDVWVSNRCSRTRVGFLFPGQGSQQLNMARVLVDRFEWARELVELADRVQAEMGQPAISPVMFPDLDRLTDAEQLETYRRELARTEVAQPAICIASVLYARFLDTLGLRPVAVGGHSLGELTAFHMAGAFDVESLVRLVCLRGHAMAARAGEAGAMAGLRCSVEEAEALAAGTSGYAVVANINSPQQVVISGEETSVLDVISAATSQGIAARRLPVSNAFHSRLVTEAADRLRTSTCVPPTPQALRATLVSGTDGSTIERDVALRHHFAAQVLSRVDFMALVETLEPLCDMLIEVGPGRVLSSLADDILGWSDVTCLPVAGRPDADHDLNIVLARAFVHGIDVHWDSLYAGRLTRPFVPVDQRQFIDNPCERDFMPTESVEPLQLHTGSDTLSAVLSAAAGANAELFAQYLERRVGFLTDVVRADLQSISHGSGLDELGLSLRDSGMHPLDDPSLGSAVVRLHTGNNRVQPASCEINEPVTIGQEPDAWLDEGETFASASPSSSKADDLHDILIQLVHQRTGFPIETITMDIRLLDELNFDSIKAGDLIATVAMQVGASGTIDPASLANATLADVASAIRQAIPGAPSDQAPPFEASLEPAYPTYPQPVQPQTTRHTPPSDVPGWVRNFTVEYVETPLPGAGTATIQSRHYGILHDPGDTSLATAIASRITARGAVADLTPFAIMEDVASKWTHVVAVLPKTTTAIDPTNRVARMIAHLEHAVALTRTSGASTKLSGISFVQWGGGRFGTDAVADMDTCFAASFARALHLEAVDLELRMIDLPPDLPEMEIARFVVDELGGPEPFRAAGYTSDGVRLEPRHRLCQPRFDPPLSLDWSAEDVILVTGGARGITAECALALAQRSSAKVALVGSSPLPDPTTTDDAAEEILTTLSRFEALGTPYKYFQCDITDAPAVAKLVADVTAALGPITAVVHGAGRNVPRRANTVSRDEAMAEVAPKLLGGLFLIEALDPQPLRLFVGLTSIIGVTGIPGNAWYAFSNEALDLLLRRYQVDHSNTIVRSLSYSVWGQVGMGAKLGLLSSLSRMGIGTIPTAEGVSRFLHCIDHDPGSVQVVITGNLGGLDTWQPVFPPAPERRRYIERLVHFEPQIDLIARTTLTLDRDLYLAHHVYRGSCLFPAVFGLEAMAQAVAQLLGETRPPIIRIEDIRLERPILVGEDGKVEIEIWAEALEIDEQGEQHVRVGVRSEQSGFGVDHFAAVLVCGRHCRGPAMPVVTGQPLAIDAKADLYNGLLFQGPLFQRWGRTFTLSREEVVFEVERLGSSARGENGFSEPAVAPLILGDPYCRDVLLQSVQGLIPQHIGLPVSIERIEFFQPDLEPGAGHHDTHLEDTTWIVTSMLRQAGDREGEENMGEVVATDRTGHVVERLTGYVVKILEVRPTNPTAAQLANLETFDQEILRRSVDADLPALGLNRPAFALRRMPELHHLSREARHVLERPLIEQTVETYLERIQKTSEQLELTWHASGRPMLLGDDIGNTAVSLSHDDDYCLCVVGSGPTGCDIAPVTSRTRTEWTALIAADHEKLLAELVQHGDSLDRAGTRIWAAVEAVQKAFDIAAPVALQLGQRHRDAVTLIANTAERQISVFTAPVSLWRHPERVIAFVASRSQSSSIAALRQQEFLKGDVVEINHHRFRGRLDGPQDQPVFEHRFLVTFKECATRSRRVQFTQYPIWFGTMRENALLHMAPNLMAQLASGEWGMATNWTDVRVVGEAMTGDVIQARLWADHVDASSVRLCCDFARVLADERLERLAFCQQLTTSVRLNHRAEPLREAFPPFLYDVFQVMAPRNDRATQLPELPEGLARFNAQRKQLQERANGTSTLVRTDEFDTCLDDANLVGNIYYARYFTWQSRAGDLFLHTTVPEIVKSSDQVQEFLALRSRMDFLRDAFPFDRIRLEMHARAVTESAAALQFVFYRIAPDGLPERLAVGEQDVIWVRRTANGSPAPAPFPEEIRRAFEGG